MMARLGGGKNRAYCCDPGDFLRSTEQPRSICSPQKGRQPCPSQAASAPGAASSPSERSARRGAETLSRIRIPASYLETNRYRTSGERSRKSERLAKMEIWRWLSGASKDGVPCRARHLRRIKGHHVQRLPQTPAGRRWRNLALKGSGKAPDSYIPLLFPSAP